MSLFRRSRQEHDGARHESERAVSWDAVMSTYLPALVLALGTGIVLPALPVLARSFHVGLGVANLVVVAFLVGGMVGSVPTGWMIDRFGRRRVMLAGPVLTSIMALMVLTAHSFPELLLYRFVDGAAAGMWLMGRLAGIAHGASTGQRGRQVSWMFSMDNAGRLIGPMTGGFIASAWGVRAPFAVYAGLALLALIPAYKYIKESDTRVRRSAATGTATRKYTVPQLVLPFLPFFGVAFFSSMARGPIFADSFHVYALFHFNLTPRQIGYLATAASTMVIPIGLTAGWMMDRYGRKRTMVPGFSGVTLAMILLALTAFLHAGLGWYFVAFCCGVASQSLTGGSVQTIGADVAPAEARGMFLGLWRFTGQIGSAVSPTIFGFITSAHDDVRGGAAFLYVGSMALVTALLLVIYIPETRKTRDLAEPVPVPAPAPLASSVPEAIGELAGDVIGGAVNEAI